MSAEPTVTGPIETITKGPRQRSWVALGAAVVGTVLTLVGFVLSIAAALDGGGHGADVELVIFFTGIALNLLAIALAVVTLARDGRRTLPIVATAVALIPALVVGMIALSVRL
jgi:hypothetical protein